MKSLSRSFWMKCHAYIACFFLPFTVLYLATGVLHLFDIHGGIKNEYHYTVPTPNGWPKDEAEAHDLVTDFLLDKSHLGLSKDYYPGNDYHDWYGKNQEVMLKLTDDDKAASLTIKEHDLWLQLLLIHKGLAGVFFWVLGILFGLHLLISAVSGVILALQLPKIKSTSIHSFLVGFAVLVGLVMAT